MKSVIVATLSLASTAALAHPGHMANESIQHGLLHGEHIIALAAFVVIAFAVKLIRNK